MPPTGLLGLPAVEFSVEAAKAHTYVLISAMMQRPATVLIAACKITPWAGCNVF